MIDVPELAGLPWETLYDSAFDRFLALSTETPLVRYLDLLERVQPLAIQPPLKMLVIISNPSDYLPLDVEREWMTVSEALGTLEQQNRVVLKRLEEPTLTALQEQLRPGEYHVLHFVGHGRFDEAAQDGELILEDKEGLGRPVSGRHLGILLRDHRSLRLAFLSACEGARASQGDPFAGVAQSLVRQGIPAVVAMQFEISDRASITLVREFYQALADGYPMDAALAEARKAVFDLESNFEWATPVLFSRLHDNQLLVPLTGDAAPIIETAYFEPETTYIPAGPFLMGSPEGKDVVAYETPQHEVHLPAYRIGRYPVTNEQYEEFIRQTGRIVPPEAGWEAQTPPSNKLDHPVSGVTWYDALAYCQWLSEQTGRQYSLPSEAQWEKAARGTDGRTYPWGNHWAPDRCNHSGPGTTPVDAYPPQGVYGCYDMIGNAREWTSSLWGKRMCAPDPAYVYPWIDDGRRDDLEAGSHTWRVYRGGAYGDATASLRCSARGGFDPRKPGPRGKRHGFRVALRL